MIIYVYDMKTYIQHHYQPGIFLVSTSYEEGVILSGLLIMGVLDDAEKVADVYGCKVKF